MCTAFVRRGNDVISGFNMDINPEAFQYNIYAEDDGFFVGMQVPNTTLKVRIHGVSRDGNFANQLNNMVFYKAPYRAGEDAVSLDRLIHAYLSDELSFDTLKETAEKKEITQMPSGIVDIPTIAFHSLITDRAGRIMILEPGNGFSVEDGLNILECVKQTGEWATKVSFVYSRNENTVYYCQDGQFDKIKLHKFRKLN